MSKFNPIRNEGKWVKPKGGLWASPTDHFDNTWADWCGCNDFRECTEENSFSFTMRDPSRIFFINSMEAWKEFERLYITKGKSRWMWDDGFCSGSDSIDFEKMVADGWDGLEISISEFSNMYNYLYCWDCDSIVVMNPDAVVIADICAEVA